jgi:pimeloyl-ACP methyl ester carboxylesterase
MPTIKTGDGVALHYTDDGAGRPMLFVSGWSMSGEWFVEQRKFFAPTNRVIILDTRAQGGSEPVTWGHRLSRHAADLRDVITALGLEDVTLVAWSRGTSVVLSYLELFGTQGIAGVALAGFLPSLAARADWPWGFNVPPQAFIDNVVADYAKVVSNMIVDMTHKKLPADFREGADGRKPEDAADRCVAHAAGSHERRLARFPAQDRRARADLRRRTGPAGAGRRGGGFGGTVATGLGRALCRKRTLPVHRGTGSVQSRAGGVHAGWRVSGLRRYQQV